MGATSCNGMGKGLGMMGKPMGGGGHGIDMGWHWHWIMWRSAGGAYEHGHGRTCILQVCMGMGAMKSIWTRRRMIA